MPKSALSRRPLGLEKLRQAVDLPDRLGGVRKEPKTLQPLPSRVEPRKETLPSIVTPRGTTLKSKVRPSNEFTIEEMRVQLAATAGPLRRWADRIWILTLSPAESVLKITDGKEFPLYVRVVPAAATQPAQRIHFSDGGPGNEQTAVSMILPDEGPFECIVMPGEALFATVDPGLAGDYRIKIFETGV
jgi:hypothetical protein